MNWDALGSIGEIVGALAVLVTLLYLSIQIRRSETSILNVTQATIQAGRVDVNEQRLRHVDLVCRANAGDPLSEQESVTLALLYQSEASLMFFTFMNFRRLGQDGAIQARNFARFLCDNPAFEHLWPDQRDKVRIDFTDLPNTTFDAWTDAVDHHMARVREHRERYSAAR